MQTFAGSWSFPSELGTPFLSGELTTDSRRPPERASRKSKRVALDMGAGLRQRGGTGVSIQILDLSVDGFRASTHLALAQDTDVWLRLPGLEALSGQGRLVEGPLCRLRLRAAAPSGRARHDREARRRPLRSAYLVRFGFVIDLC
jgi:hypothetical protein